MFKGLTHINSWKEMQLMNIAVTDDLPKEREKIIRILTEYAASNHMEISIS